MTATIVRLDRSAGFHIPVGKLDFSQYLFLPSVMDRKRGSRKIPAYVLYGEAPQRIAGPMLHIETIEARSAGHHWKIEPHLHHVLHQMMFVLWGRGVVLADGKRSQYRPPAIVLIPAGAVHGFEFEPGTKGHVISVSDDLLRGLAQREAGVTALFAQPSTVEMQAGLLHATDLAQSVRMLAREFARPDAGDGLALHGWLEVLLGNLLRLTRGLPNPADPVVGQRRQLMARFSELLERRFRDNQSVSDFARALHVSESRLRSVCLASTGQSPIQLIHARILLEAKRQLHYTSNPVSEIAYALGFEDPAYFTRFFSRLAGASPRAFRSKGPERAAARL
jgi:AraC family transcriptional activator of pobA